MQIGLTGDLGRPLTPIASTVGSIVLAWAEELAARGHEPVLIHLGVDPDPDLPYEQIRLDDHQGLGPATESCDAVVVTNFSALAMRAHCPATLVAFDYLWRVREQAAERHRPLLGGEDSGSLDMVGSLCALSDHVALDLMHTHRRPARVLVPPVQPAFLALPLPDDRERSVLFASRLTRASGVLDFLDAAERAGVDVTVIDRPSPREPDTAATVRDWIDSHPGATLVPAPATLDEYVAILAAHAHHAFVPHYVDPVGVAAIESQALGVELICLNVGGLAETTGPDVRYLPDRRISSLADALAAAVADGHDIDAAKRRRGLVERRWSPQRSTDRLLAEIRRAIEATPRFDL